MDDYYLPIRVLIPIGQPNGGTFADLWQKVSKVEKTVYGVVQTDFQAVGYFTTEGLEVTLPEVHEAYVLDKTQHFAPGVVKDPDGYTPPTMAEFKAALQASAEAVAKGDPETYTAWVAAEHDKNNEAQAKKQAAAEAAAKAAAEAAAAVPAGSPTVIGG